MAGTDSQRGEYPALVATLHPNSAVAVLNDRVRSIDKTNRDVADWLMERRRVEEAYVQGLRKLSRREPPDVSGDELGVFTPSWQRIVGGIATLADSHQTFAKRIESDVERPLREFMSHNREMQQLSTITGNLQALAKECDQAQKKTDKLRASNANSAKLADASDDAEKSRRGWESQAPFVFENLQAVDESRLNQLRDLLTQLQTHEVDQVEKNRATAESCLNALLSVNTADEIQAFAAMHAGSAERVPSRAERPPSAARDRHERRASRILPSLGGSSQPAAPSSYRPVNGSDDVAEPSETASSSNAPVTPAQDEKKPKGLRRLGTVFSRKRQSVMLRPTPGRGKSGTSQRLGSSTDLAEDPIAEDESSVTRERSREPPTASAPEPIPSPRPPRSSSMRSPNGAVSDFAPQLAPPAQAPSLTMPEPSQAAFQPAQPSAPPVMQQEPESYSTPPTSAFDAIAQAQREAAESGEGGALDAGARPYHVDIRNAPISEEGPANADQAMASVANTLRAQAAPPARRQGTLRGRRDVRNTVFVPSDGAPVFESTAPQATSSAHSSFTPAATTTRSPTEMAPAGVLPTAAVAAPAAVAAASAPMSQIAGHRQFGSEDHTSDTQSVRSGRSMASSAAGLSGTATKHAESQAPGLASSIVETVSATLEHGGIVRCAVQGELALSYNPPDAGAPAAKETIRLDNFPSLEKVAPNPNFIAPRAPGDRTPGEYTVDLPAMALATGQPAHLAHGKPSVAFKYKLHVEPSDPLSLAHRCPVLLTPSWRHEAAQSSAILTYALNPAFAGAGATLHNVFFVLHLAGARAASCQSKPAGTFSKRENLLYWHFDELPLGAPGAAQKLIARFATDGAASGGRVEARWETPGAAAAGALGVSRLEASASDPFADESAASAAAGAWAEVGGSRRLVSGSYVAT